MAPAPAHVLIRAKWQGRRKTLNCKMFLFLVCRFSSATTMTHPQHYQANTTTELPVALAEERQRAADGLPLTISTAQNLTDNPANITSSLWLAAFSTHWP